MIKFLLLCLFSFPLLAGTAKIAGNPLMTDEQGMELLKDKFSGEEKRFIFSNGFKDAYTNGDFVVLWGVGASTSNQSITETEYKGLWRLMNYLSSNGFRVIMNVRATSADVKVAAETATTSVLLFSGHGNKTAFYDWNENPVDFNVFKKASPSLYQIIISACESRIALDANYVIPDRIHTIGWTELTNSTELLDYLVSDDWSALTGKPKL